MSPTSLGLARNLLAIGADGPAVARQSLSTAMLKQQAAAEASLVGLVEQVLETARTDPPRPPGQGSLVDLRV